MKNMLDYDHPFRESGILRLCGIDEAGRGPLAGPVVAAAVVFPPGTEMPEVNDSKKLSPGKRMQLEAQIKKYASDFGIGEASGAEIDRLNIVQATFLAMNRAVDNLNREPDYILVDGNQFPAMLYRSSGKTLSGKAVIKGDGRSLSIAAASILAKVHRDRYMERIALEYPGYGFERHKGYGTEEHRRKIRELGPLPEHRKSFITSYAGEQLNLTDLKK